MKKLSWLFVWVLGAASAAVGDIVWSEDFSSVSAWSIIANPSNDASVASDGNIGSFSEPSPGLLWPVGAAFAPTNRIEFDPLNSDLYTFIFTVVSISGSMSFDIGFDCFSNDYSYVGTVWDIFPNQAFTGTTNINLGSFTFDSGTMYVSPKLTLHTGDGTQTVGFDSMSIDQQVIPEPGTLALVIGGLAVVLLRRRAAR